MVVLAARGTPATTGSAVGGGAVPGGCRRAMASSGGLGLDCLGSGVGAFQASHEGGFGFAGGGGSWAMTTAEHFDCVDRMW